MNYRKDKYGNQISVLGFGCMRFQKKAGRIDMEKAKEQILLAYENGVNYYDTAYIYPGSEEALGEILQSASIRDKVNIATKLPHYLIKNHEGLEKYFQEELRRLRTHYIDYYLMHMLTDVNAWERLLKCGIVEWIEEKKKSGEIRQVGFSYHGNTENFCKLIDCYDWDFCQIQYNYMDENSQAGKRGLQYAASKGLPVIIMEPLRGGKLVKMLPREAETLMRKHPGHYSPAQWAFRWLWDQKEVTCVLSGMNTLEMIKENTDTASLSKEGCFTQEDRQMLEQVAAMINGKMKVGCTGCAYCMPCPKHVDIPGTFAAYNRTYTENYISGFTEYFMCTALRKEKTSASNCVQCGKCEKHCPQNIPIRQELKAARKRLENPVYSIGRNAVRLFRKY